MEQKKVLGIALLITFGFGIIEFLTGIYTNSLALVSDAGHMFTDSAALLIAFIGSYLASKNGTNRMTYGLKRAEVLSSFINAIFLIFLIGYILYEFINRFFSPVEIMAIPMLTVAFIGLILNLIMVFLLHNHAHENINLKVAFLHVIFDTIGSISTLIAGIVILLTQTYVADLFVSLGLTLLIIPQIYNILRISIEIFLETAPSHIPLEKIEAKIRSLPYVEDLHDLHLWSLTPKDHIFTAHIVVNDIKNSTEAIQRINTILNEYGIKHTTIQVEEANTDCFLKNGCLHSSFPKESLH